MAEAPYRDATTARLQALASYDILDTPPEQGFDDLVELAAQMCGTQTALVSLVDERRQWFKARVGFDSCETPLSQSVCRLALEQDDLLVIPDLTADPRTRDNTLVTHAPFIRFYAGAQLRAPTGVAIGTLCVIDGTPRSQGLTDGQAKMLRALARQVVALLELRQALADREAALRAQDIREADLQRDADRHALLFDLHRRIDAADSADAVYRLLVEGCLDLVSAAEGAAVELRDGDVLVYEAAAGHLAPHLGHRIAIGESLSGLSLRQGQALRAGDALNDNRIDPVQARLLDLRSMVVVPIVRHGRHVGILKVGSRALDAFDDRDLQAVQLLAAAATVGLAGIGEAQAQKGIRSSEARYRTIFESATDVAIVATDLGGRITNWNEGASRLIGWSADAILGQPIDVIFRDEDRRAQEPERDRLKALETGRSFDERWHQRRDGSMFWASAELMALTAPDGASVGFVKMLRDRTAQHAAEDESRLRGERLDFAFEAAGNAGWWDWDVARNLVYANAGFAELYGVDPAKAAAGLPVEHFLEAIDPRDRSRIEAAIRRVTEGGGEFAEEYRLTTAGGKTRWVLVRGRGSLDPHGRPLRFPGVVIEITERKETERLQGALLTLGDRLREAADAAAVSRAYGEVTASALGVGRAGFATFDAAAGTASIDADWAAPGVSSIAGRHQLDHYGTFGADLRAGEVVVVPDVTRDPRTSSHLDQLLGLGVRALINVPIVERGELGALFFVNHATPRVWSPQEVVFVRDAADRTWAALRRMIAEERQSILNQELSHRMKNTLAMVQGIATHTMRNATSLTAARDTLTARLMVFGKAHDILLAEGVESTDLVQVIRAVLSLHGDGAPGRIRLDGHDIPIGRRAALSLALMLHELATNAVKYGSLSVPGGVIDIGWTVHDTGGVETLTLTWQERGGPPVRTPTRKGFGSRLIERGFSGTPGARVAIDYAAGGLVCTLQVPSAALLAET